MTSVKRKHLDAATAFVLLFCFAEARAKDLDITSFARQKPAVISGVLSPASLSFNGKEIVQSSESYEALLLNDVPVSLQEAGGLKSFYLEIEDSSIDLKWRKAGFETVDVLKIEYPAVTELRYSKNKIILKFNAVTSAALLDTERLSQKESSVEYGIHDVAAWLQDVHTLELTSDKKTSRLYNLDLRPLATELLTVKSWALYHSDAPFWGNGNSLSAFGVGYRILTPDRRSMEYIVSLSQNSYEMGWFGPIMNAVTQEALQLKARFGFDPFATNPGSIDYKRVTLGLSAEIINYRRRSTFATQMDGFDTDHVDVWYLQGGFFIRWEPLQYENFGFIFSTDNRIFRTRSEVSSKDDNKSLGFSYTF